MAHKLFAVLAWLSVACFAAQEEACVDSEVKQLVQSRSNLKSQFDEAEDILHPEATGTQKCPWQEKENQGCHTVSRKGPLCANGKFSWSCNQDGHGERLQCPCFLPYMCAQKGCGQDGMDYCCEPDCTDFGGLRPCEGKVDSQPTLEPRIAPTKIAPTPPPPAPLTDKGEDPDGKLAACEGDCDKDSGCADGLKCYQRNGYTLVPGCDGIGIEGHDYCYDPKKQAPLKVVGANPPKASLDACSGDCDSDATCKEGLVCFQQHGETRVPGCSGDVKEDYDYCIEPVLNDNGVDPSGDDLNQCTGDCDSDSDCRSGLECFQRSAFEPVPGCSGSGAKGWDYCYDPSKA